MNHDGTVVRLRGARALRARLVLATVCKRKVEVSKIREMDEEPGLHAAEACFVRLLDKLTSGSRVEINSTGTRLRYAPGFLAGGKVDHDVAKSGKGVGWFLEAILPLVPFFARPLELTLTGVTCGAVAYRSADAIKHGTLPLMRLATGGVALDLTVERREAVPKPSVAPPTEASMMVTAPLRGRVTLKCSRCQIEALDLDDPGLVKAVRGVAFCTRTSPSLANRVVAGAQRELRPLVHDVRVVTDAAARRDCAPVAGFGCVLVAESTTGVVRSAELDIHDFRDEDDSPEQLGARCAELLLKDLGDGGCCDAANQPLLLTLMALGPEDAAVAHLGPLTKRAVERLRLIKKFVGVVFKLQHQPNGSIRAACLGAGFANFSRAAT